MGTFDPASFLDQTTTEAGSTSLEPVPVGEYTAMATWTSKDGTKSGLRLDITWEIDDQALKAKLARDVISVRQGIMLDMTQDGSGIDWGKGKNVTLGRLREALGLNKPGEPFSFRMIAGKVAKISIAHRAVNDAIYADVKGVAKLA